MVQAQDERMMRAALAYSRWGWGQTAPNPSVAALVVCPEGYVIGRGRTGFGGRPHAEPQALAEAGVEARGATLYVTLEPCNHYGQTGPCVEAILKAGIRRVVSALEDPNERVQGRAHQRLREAGLDVSVGICQEEARRIHAGHCLRMTQKRPFITVKMAETADHLAAGGKGEPRLLITGEETKAHVHIMRQQHDAVMVGRGTLVVDDPHLTIRLPGVWAQPWRIGLDTHLALSEHSKWVQQATESPSLLFTGPFISLEKKERLQKKGLLIEEVPLNREGHLDLKEVLARLAQRGVTRLLNEGGPQLASALIAEGFADQVVMVRSPKLYDRPGLKSLSPVAFSSLKTLYQERESCLWGLDHVLFYERKA